MRILLIGEQVPDNPVSSIIKVLHKDHEVTSFDVYKEATPFGFDSGPNGFTRLYLGAMRLWNRYEFARANKRLIDFVRDWKPDWILAIRMEEIHPETIHEIRRSCKCIISGWFMDSIAKMGREFMLAADYDGLFFTDRFIVEKLRKHLGNARIHFLPLCADPEIHHPEPMSPEERSALGCDLAVFGNPYYSRLQTLSVLDSYNLKIYGIWPTWATHPLRSRWQGRAIYESDKVKALLAAKIVVNTTHLSAIDAVNKRVFEVAAIGVFQLTQAPGLDGLFDKNEIVCFESPAELKEMVDYYLAHPEERTMMAARARDRVRREHTYAHRINEMMGKLGLGGLALYSAENVKMAG